MRYLDSGVHDCVTFLVMWDKNRRCGRTEYIVCRERVPGTVTICRRLLFYSLEAWDSVRHDCI